MASTIASSLQQMSMSLGFACGTSIVGWYLAELPPTDPRAVTSVLHYAFLSLDVLTVLSSLTFLEVTC